MEANKTSTTGNLPPHDIAAEECVIGSLMIDGEQIINTGTLQACDFYHEPLGIIFSACQTLYHRHEAINQITVGSELQRIGKLEDCGGVSYLIHMVSVTPSPLDIDSYSDVVRRHSVSRQAIVLGQKIEYVGFESNPDSKTTVEKVNGLVSEFRKNSGKFRGLITPRETADIMFDTITKYKNNEPVIRWGYPSLDAITSGIHASEFIVIGARPSIGKTQLMLDVAENVGRQGKKILFVSAEMSIQHLLERKVAHILHKSIRELRKGNISEDDEAKIMERVALISESNTYWLAANTSSQQIYSEAARLQEQTGLDIVFVDYLQKLTDCYGEKENQNIRVGRACKTLKDLSFDLNIPVIAASQLSRGVEHRVGDDQIPTLSDLRDSGSIEQDADVVFLLHGTKDGTANDGGVKDPSLLYIKMAKNRQLGTAPHQKLRWNDEQHRYCNYGTIEEFEQEEIF